MALSTRDRLFVFASPLGEDALLVQDMEVREALSQTYHVRLSLVAEHDGIASEDLVGKRASLRVETPDGERFWTGVVSRFMQTGRIATPQGEDAELFGYGCELVPWVWHLLHHEDSRIFQAQSVPDIVEAVFADFGYSDYELHLSGEHPPLPYCVQYRERNLDFVARLLESEGIHYFFRHEAETEVLVLTDNRDHAPRLEPDHVPFHATALAEDADSITGLVRRQDTHTGRFVLRDHDFERPTADLEVVVDTVVRLPAIGSHERFIHPGGYLARERGDALARVRMEAEEAGHDTFDGEGNVRQLVAGSVFALVDHPDEARNIDYLVTAVAHRGGNNLGFGAASRYRNRFSVIPHAVPYRAPLATPRPRVQGPQTAVVVGPAGEEIHTDKYGRVKVKFRWDRTPHAGDRSSCWLRVAQMWAGRQWGAMFVPRIGMEVLVDFLEGDPDQPIVVGCLYNGDNMPPYELPKHGDITTMRSHSTKGGGGHNELRFVDRKGHEQLMLHAQSRMDFCVRGNFCETNGGQRDLRVGKDFNLLNKGDLNWTAATGWYQSVEADLDLTARANVHHDLQGDVIEIIAGLLEINPDTLSLVAANTINVKGYELIAELASTLSMRGGTIVLEGSEGGITLKCGGSFITIGPAGIAIQGPLVTINSGGQPQSSLAATPAAPIVMEEPLEPAGCQCSTPGENLGGGGGGGSGGGGSRQRKKKTVDPHNPPDWVPPKPPKPPKPPEVAPPPQLRPCDIAALDVDCGHKKRPRAGDALQVVATASVLVDGEKHTFGKVLELDVSAMKGDHDTLVIGVVLSDAQACDEKRMQWAVTRGGAPAESEWRSDLPGKYQVADMQLSTSLINPPTNPSPDRYYVFGRGATERIEQTRVEVFPARQCKGSLTFKADWVTTIEKSVNKALAVADFFLPTESKLEITGPGTGKAAVEWGWAEHTDWRAFFALSVDAGFDPLLKISGSLKADGVQLVAKAKFLKALAKHLAQVYIKVEVAGSVSLVGRFQVTGPGASPKGIEPKGQIEITATAGVALGSASLLGAEIRGGGKSSISATGALEWQDPNLWFRPKFTFDGLKVDLKFIYTVWATHEETLGTVDLLDKQTILEGQYKLLGP